MKRNEILWKEDLQPSQPTYLLKNDQEYLLISEFIYDIQTLENMAKTDKGQLKSKIKLLPEFMATMHKSLNQNYDQLINLIQKRENSAEKTANRLGASFRDTQVGTYDALTKIAAQIQAAHDNIELTIKNKKILIHDDLWTPNIILDENKSNGLVAIDYEMLREGHPGSDIARLGADLRRFIPNLDVEELWNLYLAERKDMDKTDPAIRKTLDKTKYDAFFLTSLERAASHMKLLNSNLVDNEEQANMIKELLKLAKETKPAVREHLDDFLKETELQEEAKGIEKISSNEEERTYAIQTSSIGNLEGEIQEEPKKRGKKISWLTKVKGAAEIMISLLSLNIASACAVFQTGQLPQNYDDNKSNQSCAQEDCFENYSFKFDTFSIQRLNDDLERTVISAYNLARNIDQTNYLDVAERETQEYFVSMNLDDKQATLYTNILKENDLVEDFYLVKDQIKLELEQAYTNALQNYIIEIKESNYQEFLTQEEILEDFSKQYIIELVKVLKKAKQS